MSIISSEQTILLTAVILVIVALAIYLEQRYKWASFVGAFFICITGGFILSNINLIPHSAPAFSTIDGVILLVALPMFLFKADLKAIFKESGRLFGLFHIAAAGSLVGVLIMALVLGKMAIAKHILPLVAAGTVGGTVNCVAVGKIFGLESGFLDTYLVADNFTFCLMVLMLNLLHNSQFIKRLLPRPLTDKLEASVDKEKLKAEGKTISAGFWGGKEISLKDIAIALAASFSIIGVSQVVAGFIQSLGLPGIVNQLFGNVYMVLTIITVVLATAFPKLMGTINGSMELGNIGFLMWFTMVGVSADFMTILQNGIVIICVCFCVFIVNMIFCIVGAKFIKCSWEDAVVANMASIGGPPTVAAIAGSFGWSDIIIPGMLVGLWGYVIGNYFGVFIGNLLM